MEFGGFEKLMREQLRQYGQRRMSQAEKIAGESGSSMGSVMLTLKLLNSKLEEMDLRIDKRHPGMDSVHPRPPPPGVTPPCNAVASSGPAMHWRRAPPQGETLSVQDDRLAVLMAENEGLLKEKGVLLELLREATSLPPSGSLLERRAASGALRKVLEEAGGDAGSLGAERTVAGQAVEQTVEIQGTSEGVTKTLSLSVHSTAKDKEEGSQTFQPQPDHLSIPGVKDWMDGRFAEQARLLRDIQLSISSLSTCDTTPTTHRPHKTTRASPTEPPTNVEEDGRARILHDEQGAAQSHPAALSADSVTGHHSPPPRLTASASRTRKVVEPKTWLSRRQESLVQELMQSTNPASPREQATASTLTAVRRCLLLANRNSCP